MNLAQYVAMLRKLLTALVDVGWRSFVNCLDLIRVWGNTFIAKYKSKENKANFTFGLVECQVDLSKLTKHWRHYDLPIFY